MKESLFTLALVAEKPFYLNLATINKNKLNCARVKVQIDLPARSSDQGEGRFRENNKTDDVSKVQGRVKEEEVVEEGEIISDTIDIKDDSKKIPHSNTGVPEEKDDPIDTNQELNTKTIVVAPVAIDPI
ncbi:hypothetical protein HAX54_044221 [Datura stramonium]|uniref:Uncharacterized protein n=1 Tax=Datura stramonium TaxID=4076 RepID=A0ABS8SNX8_DATST|nr:hypothetical protein [Datura stramonium]